MTWMAFEPTIIEHSESSWHKRTHETNTRTFHPRKGNNRPQSLGSFVWSIAEILRGDFKQSDYGKVILPFVVMRRLDCILEGSKNAVWRPPKPYQRVSMKPPKT